MTILANAGISGTCIGNAPPNPIISGALAGQ
jgi:hypothetical protein